MFRCTFLCFTVLATLWIFVSSQDPITEAVTEQAATDAPASGGQEETTSEGANDPNDGKNGTMTLQDRKLGNSSSGNDIWEKWNLLGMSDKDPSWLVKYCPKGVVTNYEMFCVMHCWWNGWQGGKCTKDNFCVCLWDGLKLDFEGTGRDTVPLPPGKNSTFSHRSDDPNAPMQGNTSALVGDGTPEPVGDNIEKPTTPIVELKETDADQSETNQEVIT